MNLLYKVGNLLAAYACLLFVLLTVANADEPTLEAFEFSTPSIGTKAQWKNLDTDFQWTITIRESEGDYIYSYFSETGETRNLVQFCLYCGSTTNKIEFEKYSRLFPLEVGKKAKVYRTRVGDSTRSWTHWIEVNRTEWVDTPFSDTPVATYVVEEKIKNNRGGWSGNVTYWFAPSLMSNVRVLDDANDDKNKITEFQLTNYQLP